MKAKLRGTELFFDVAGMQYEPSKKGYVEKPVLFLLHGGPGSNHFRYKQHSLELQHVAQLVFIDHRGCGLSKRTKQKEYTLANNIEDIEALRKYLGLPKICILGTSYGGMVAQGYAIKYSRYIDKLILAVTAPSYRFLSAAKTILKAHGNQAQISGSRTLFEGKFKSNHQLVKFLEKMSNLYSHKTGKRSDVPSPFSWSYQALNAGFGGFLKTFDFLPKLHKIKCPTLILAGKEDWICPPSQSMEIAKHIPNAQLKIFANCSHYIAVDQHEKYINIITRFLTK